MSTPEAGLDDKPRAPAFLMVGKLVGENAGQSFRGHSGARQNPRPLQERRRGDHDYRIALRGKPDLEQ